MFQPSTTEISRCLTIQEDRERLTLLLVFSGLTVVLGMWGCAWYHAMTANQYQPGLLGWRLMLAGLMAAPLLFGAWVIWRD